MIGHCYSNSKFIVIIDMLFCIFRTTLVLASDMCGKYIIKEYDAVSIYGMHTAAVGCPFES